MQGNEFFGYELGEIKYIFNFLFDFRLNFDSKFIDPIRNISAIRLAAINNHKLTDEHVVYKTHAVLERQKNCSV